MRTLNSVEIADVNGGPVGLIIRAARVIGGAVRKAAGSETAKKAGAAATGFEAGRAAGEAVNSATD